MDFNPRSREGSDAAAGRSGSIPAISIHAPAKGATMYDTKYDTKQKISIHAPAKGATLHQLLIFDQIRFQSTLPRRERHDSGALVYTEKEDFNPRSREGSDADKAFKTASSGAFQSTLPRRERQWQRAAADLERHFNPRSREGSDKLRKRKSSERSRFQSTLPRRERQWR